MNENWHRWVVASIQKHIADHSILAGVQKRYEADLHRVVKAETGIEIRIDGPVWNETSKDRWFGRIEANILCYNSLSVNNNLYTIRTLMGKCEKTFQKKIELRKYGGEVGDDGSFVECMFLQKFRNTDNQIVSGYFGQVDPAVKEEQGTVEAHYKVELDYNG